MAAVEIDLGKLPFDIDFHPSDHLVAAGLINGDLLLYRYNADSPAQKLLEVKAHTESCRAVRFINEGRAIVTGSPDCSILATDVETGSEIIRLENSHGAAVNRIVNLTESTIASGDDEGCIKLAFPNYLSLCRQLYTFCEEYISDITFAADSMKLLATSGDGSLSVCNLRSSKIQTRSEFSEEELLSVVIMKNGRKVICGTQSGTLLLYSWGFFKDCSDRFVDLSPNSIDALLKLDEDRVITGSENGLISLVGILPNKIIQPIAEHSEYPVERLAFSHDRKYLGSASHDNLLKFWDLNELLLQDSEDGAKNDSTAEDSDTDGMDVDDNIPKSSKGSKKKNVKKGRNPGTSNNFFAEL
ncbi:WD repeat-containing protein 55 [Lycium ferocissimum]|uniref:WD repeat-containing protein 55 n=1 Tax=Lycium ferocissimum TaxID=112874 RepID=UPI0028155433|nr:WD repeat-containing protein 55 [Lycium ferocissimum]